MPTSLGYSKLVEVEWIVSQKAVIIPPFSLALHKHRHKILLDFTDHLLTESLALLQICAFISKLQHTALDFAKSLYLQSELWLVFS